MKTLEIINKEEKHQNEVINLIASENYPSKAVRKATGSLLTAKYAEGYPGQRYYAGCENYDAIEKRGIDLVKKLFKAEHANIQPHSGSAANMAVYFASLKSGDKILGPDMFAGGHLTHGSKVNFSGKLYQAHFYSVNPKTGLLDYDEIERIATEVKPKLIICGASAYPRIIDFEKFGQIAKRVKALLMSDIAHIAGLIVARMHPSPVGIADFITFTTQKTMRGPRGGVILSSQKWAQKIDQAVFPLIQGGPLMHQIAAKTVCFEEVLEKSFIKYQEKIIANAQSLAKTLLGLGLKVTTGGTDNHLLVLDLTNMNLTGLDAEKILQKIGILVNREIVPGDKKSARITSGIRIGTPAMTTRGMGEAEMQKIAIIIAKVLKNKDKQRILSEAKRDVLSLIRKFPILD